MKSAHNVYMAPLSFPRARESDSKPAAPPCQAAESSFFRLFATPFHSFSSSASNRGYSLCTGPEALRSALLQRKWFAQPGMTPDDTARPDTRIFTSTLLKGEIHMSMTINQSFVTQYAADVQVTYQQRGSKLRNTVRLQENVEGSKCVFQKVGKGTAGKKTRHGNVPLMNLNHSSVSCTLSDWYAAEYIDKLDELKDKHNEQRVAVDAGAWALGRKTDELIISKLSTASNIIPAEESGLTKDKILQAFGTLNNADVADDGNRFAVVGPHQWNELLNIQEFKSSDYAGQEFPWLHGTESRTWLGITWMFHTGLPLQTGTRSCYIYHRNAVGLAEGMEVKAFVDWVPEKAAHLVDHMLSAGACLIDPDGVIEIKCDDEAVIV